MDLSKDEIDHVAILARLSLGETETEAMRKELTAILGYVDELEKAPTEGLEPISQIRNLENIAREDIIEPSLETEKILQNAPDKKEGFIKVKKVF